MNQLALQATLDVMNGITCVLMGLALIAIFVIHLHRDPPFDIPWERR